MPCSDPGEYVKKPSYRYDGPALLHLSTGGAGNAIALESNSRSITYAELEQLSTQLAGYLHNAGVQKGTVVATLLPKSHLPPICHLAILKSGGTVISLDPSHPSSRYHDILQQIPSPIVLTLHDTLEVFSGYRVLEVSDMWLDKLPSTDFMVDLSQSPDSTAWITTTSGSTGVPKLIALTHNALSCAFPTHADFLELDSNCRLLHFCSPSFDVSIAEVFLTLAAGATLVIPTDDERLNHLGDVIRTRRVSHAVLTPSVARLLNPEQLPDLETLVLTGECMGPRDVEMWANELQLVNLYGPAEASVWAAGRKVDRGSYSKNVGRGLWGALDIVNIEGDDTVAIGEVGELVICGPGVAHYLGGQVGGFVDTWKNFGRGFRTGDLAKWTEDGDVIVLGRFGSVVKVRGQRLDVGEVEGAIMTAGAGDIAVLVPNSGLCEGRLIAVVETFSHHGAIALDESDTNHDTISQLREAISGRLPAYMVPSLWIPVTSLPLTASGKLDRKHIMKWISSISAKLYKRILAINSGHKEVNEPTSLAERSLRGIWASALGITVEEVGETSFVRLGGDSITAMQVISQCRAEGLAVTVKDILSANNAADLLQRSRPVRSTVAVTAKTVEDDRLFPLSAIQALWFDIAPSGPGNYTQSFLFEIEMPHSEAFLRKAVGGLLERHAMLRARFQQASQGWMQFISSELETAVRINFLHVESLEPVKQIIEETQRTALDIQRGPIIAFDVFEVSDRRKIMYITAHHLVIDLVSWRIILGDLSDLLRSKERLKPPPPHFCNWVQTKYSGMPTSPIRRIFYGNSTVHAVSLAHEASSRIINHADHSETLVLIIASLFHSYRSYFSRPLSTIFNESHGRNITITTEPDISSTVGWFTTISSISPRIRDDWTFSDTLDAVRSCKLSAERTHKMNRNMGVLFNFRGGEQLLPEGFRLVTEMGLQPTEEGASEVPRLAETEIEGVITRDGRLELVWTYPTGREEVRGWAEQCRVLLEGQSSSDMYFLRNPSIQGLGDAKQRHLLSALHISQNQVETIFPVKCTIQLSILQAQQQFSGTPDMYHPFQQWTIRPAPTLERVQAAWNKLVEAHDILRTSFHQVEGTWYGVVRYFAAAADSNTPPALTMNVSCSNIATISLRLSHAQIDGYSTDYLWRQFLHLLSPSTFTVSPSSHHNHFLSDQTALCSSSTTCTRPTPTSPPGRWLGIPLIFPSFSAINSAAVESNLTVASVLRGIWCLAMTQVIGPRGSVEYFVSTRTPELESVVGPMLDTYGCGIELDDGVGVREILKTLEDRNIAEEDVFSGARICTLVNYRRKKPVEYSEWEVEEHWCHDPMLYHMVCEVLQDEEGLVGRIGYWENWVGENVLLGMVEEVKLGLERFLDDA